MKKMKKTLLKIFNDLSDCCQECKVISEGELALKIKECVASLGEAEREALERRVGVGEGLEEAIFKSVTTRDEKLSVFSPDLHTRINYQGEVFYCLPTHRYLSAELEAAFLRWARLRSPLSALEGVVRDVLVRCGYQIENEGRKNKCVKMSAVKSKNKNENKNENENENEKMQIFVFPSIKFVPHFVEEMQKENAEGRDGGDGEKVIVVPTEKTPAPFISFLREQGQEIGEAMISMIWVADLEKRTLNPFIGNPEDDCVEKNFANPEQARRAVSVWMRRMPFFEL